MIHGTRTFRIVHLTTPSCCIHTLNPNLKEVIEKVRCSLLLASGMKSYITPFPTRASEEMFEFICYKWGHICDKCSMCLKPVQLKLEWMKKFSLYCGRASIVKYLSLAFSFFLQRRSFTHYFFHECGVAWCVKMYKYTMWATDKNYSGYGCSGGFAYRKLLCYNTWLSTMAMLKSSCRCNAISNMNPFIWREGTSLVYMMSPECFQKQVTSYFRRFIWSMFLGNFNIEHDRRRSSLFLE